MPGVSKDFYYFILFLSFYRKGKGEGLKGGCSVMGTCDSQTYNRGVIKQDHPWLFGYRVHIGKQAFLTRSKLKQKTSKLVFMHYLYSDDCRLQNQPEGWYEEDCCIFTVCLGVTWVNIDHENIVTASEHVILPTI